MPELPDVEIFKQEAEKALHRRIKEVHNRDPDFVQVSWREFNQQIIGKELKQVRRKGKYLFLETGDRSTVVLHFGMTGLLKYAPEEEAAPDYAKLTFELDNRHHLHYVSKRKLGRVEIADDPGKYAEEQDLGTDAFQMEKDEFMEMAKGGRAMVKSFLMDQSSISGIGNVYSDEMLYQAGIHPKTKSGKLSEKQIAQLYRQMKYVLETAIDREADVTRMPGTWLLPNREEGADCPRCHGRIRTTKVSGRTACYCPSCQKK